MTKTGAFATGFFYGLLAAICGLLIGAGIYGELYTTSFDSLIVTLLAPPALIVAVLAVVAWWKFGSYEGGWGVCTGGLFTIVALCVFATYALGNMRLSM